MFNLLVKIIWISVAFFLLHHHVISHEFLYSEMEYLGGSCYPRDSCRPFRNDDEDHLWGSHSCECGEHCIRYGTCCADSPHYGKILHIAYRGESCRKLSGTSDAVVVVYRCPERWRWFQIREKCEAPVLNTEDPLMEIPVTSKETNVTYKNYFCAMCNYDNRDISMWNVSLQLKTKESTPVLSNVTDEFLRENVIFNKESKSWGIVVDNGFHNLKLQFKIPSVLQKLVKKCYRNMVTTKCDESHYKNFQLQYKCLSYYAPIQIQQNGTHIKKYRNIHCAMCNSVNITDTDMNICILDLQKPKTKKPFSFALLLDINKKDGDLVGLKKVCDNNNIWDPFSKKCRALVCVLPGFVVKDGKCVAI